MSEFDLIKQYFNTIAIPSDHVELGIGDDCALINHPSEHQLAISTDTLVSGIHFFSDVDPERLGHKCLAVNLSDLAAMGAKPAWFTLAITLPEPDEHWLAAFTKGLASLAQEHQVPLIGGDTTRGPLSITIQAHGIVKKGQALRRDTAKVGDTIYVSGSLGDAAAGLAILSEHKQHEEQQSYLIDRLEIPTPRSELGQSLTGIANAVIDISDGLMADLNHILSASDVGAEIQINALPLSSALVQNEQRLEYALYGGDDYELCFTVAPEKEKYLTTMHRQLCRPIGTIVEGKGIKLFDVDEQIELVGKNYDHFS